MKDYLDYSLLHHNTFGLEAKCERFVEYESVSELQQVLQAGPTGSGFLSIGEGSNLLFTKDFDGTVLHSAIRILQVVEEDADSVVLEVGAGYHWDDFVAYCVAHGYYGLENLSLIPGEVGASAVQNIGAYGVEAKDAIVAVGVVEMTTGKCDWIDRQACCYAYRSSRFKHDWKGRFVITHVRYRLSKTFKPDLEYGALRREIEARRWRPEELTAARLRQLIIDIRNSKLPDPKDMGSAGSFFMNPIVPRECFEALQARYPEMPHYDLPTGVKIPAGWLIEQCGWKGKTLGRAGVYEKQALVLVNRGGATGQDIVHLSQTICKDVENKFGISIQPEVIWI